MKYLSHNSSLRRSWYSAPRFLGTKHLEKAQLPFVLDRGRAWPPRQRRDAAPRRFFYRLSETLVSQRPAAIGGRAQRAHEGGIELLSEQSPIGILAGLDSAAQPAECVVDGRISGTRYVLPIRITDISPSLELRILSRYFPRYFPVSMLPFCESHCIVLRYVAAAPQRHR